MTNDDALATEPDADGSVNELLPEDSATGAVSINRVGFVLSDGETERSFDPVHNGTSMEEFAFWQADKPSNDPATGLEESDSVVFVIHQSNDGSLGLFMLVDAPLDGTGGEVEIELEGLGDTAMGSPYLALDIRDAGDVYDLADGAFYFKWSGKWADFVGVGDIGDDACFRVQPTLLDGVDSIKVVDGATLSTLDIPDPWSAFSICASVGGEAEQPTEDEADVLTTATHDESDEAHLNAETALELPLSCLEILANNDAAPSGWYDIQIANSVRTLYCDMETDGGGWTGLTDVVTELDGCDGLTGANTTDAGACEIEGTTATMEIGAPGSWQEVRARVELRVKGTLDAFGWNHQPDAAKLADTYVDGASLSIGTSVHLHTWAVGFGLETNGARNARCPVDGGREAPSFVGTDYLCEGHAHHGNHWNDSTYFGDVIVTRTLEEPTDEDLLFRLMRDESTSNENVSLISLDIWLR